jgi:alpha-beta hydrolase superfamily lysophospholipase
MNERTGVAAGVPYLALPPPNDVETPALVVVLHMMDPPRNEAAMAAALPMSGVPAWRAYLGLPMFGHRAPAGGQDEFFRLLSEDALMNLLAPVVEGAAAELPSAVDALRDHLGTGSRPVALVGGSAGAAAVLLALAETDVPAAAVAVVNPAVRVAAIIEAGERQYGMTYPWDAERRAKAAQLDLVGRGYEIATRDPQPPILILQGEDDDAAFVTDTAELYDLLRESYRSPEAVRLIRIPGLAHALADEPGVEPAPQSAGAAAADTAVTDWLRPHLS